MKHIWPVITNAVGCKWHCKVDIKRIVVPQDTGGTGKFEGVHRKLPRMEREKRGEKRSGLKKMKLHHTEKNGTKLGPEEH